MPVAAASLCLVGRLAWKKASRAKVLRPTVFRLEAVQNRAGNCRCWQSDAFFGLVHRRDIDGFERWLAKASDCRVPELRRFATGLKADLSAVRAAFTSEWSSGQVEGQVNRLKFVKRQMYGRAKLDLLRIRVLHPN